MTKGGVLIAGIVLIVIGLVLGVILDKPKWDQVLAFYTGFIIYAYAGALTAVGTAVVVDKFKKPDTTPTGGGPGPLNGGL